MKNAQCRMKTLALLAAIVSLAADMFAQATETGGAAGFAAHGSALCVLDAAWATTNHVRRSAYFEDYDQDLLENWAEEVLGTSPWTNDLSSAIAASALSIGALDLVPSRWKAAHGFRLADVCARDDPDLDGWDNWSEWMAGTDPRSAESHPAPGLRVTLDCSTARSDKGYDSNENDLSSGSSSGGPAPIYGAKLVIHAYSRFDMNGWPDAVFVKDFSSVRLDTWPMTVTVGEDDLIYGHLREGRNWFYAWFNVDGSSLDINGGNWPTWTNPEPAAIADNQFDGIEIGYGLNEVAFHLTDKAESFARISWEDRGWHESVYVKIEYIARVFNKVVEWPRTWIHEGDIIAWNAMNRNATKQYGLGVYDTLGPNNEAARLFDVSYSRKSAYDLDVVSEVFISAAITNWVHATLPDPVVYAPVNGEIVASSTVEFQFSLDPEYTEYQFVLKKEGATIYDSRVLAPGRYRNDADGGRHNLVIWRFPYCVGDRIGSAVFSDNSTYSWTVTACSPGIKNGTTPASGAFRTSLAGARVVVAYETVTNGAPGAVAVYGTPALSGQPLARVALPGNSGVVSIPGLMRGGPYFLMGERGDAFGVVGGRRPVPVFAEDCSRPASITNRLIIRNWR